MTFRNIFPRFATMSLICVLGAAMLIAEEKSSTKSEAVEEQKEIPRVSLEEAREQAELMHFIYNSTLETLHDRYFHGDRAMVPARAMIDVFRDMERRTHTKARWISASLKPMSIDNKPETDFEKRAAMEISKGESKFETVEDGYYRRAGSISLNHGCIGCHAGLSNTSTSRQFAGLVISVPVNKDVVLTPASKSSPESAPKTKKSE
ncbi:c-type heme family protein [Thalassoglobus sp.]|uniref:c-type heme family protein n=1 Tax=Thalassoglobus sp. TaxID=2795869 RepID=UPI003AA9036C